MPTGKGRRAVFRRWNLNTIFHVLPCYAHHATHTAYPIHIADGLIHVIRSVFHGATNFCAATAASAIAALYAW